MDNFLMNTYAPLSPIFTHGIGTKLYDTEGTEYLDFSSGIGVNSLGYGDKDLISAISIQANSLCHISNLFLNEKSLELSKILVEKSEMSKVFFSNSGAEANECAIKLARKYSFDKYNTRTRGTIITLKSSFHGRTLTTLKATGQEKFHNYFHPFPHGFKYVTANNINEFLEHLTSDVCAVMMESIQGEGGVHPLDYNFVSKVFEECKKRDILTIFDEVQCGIYRTGRLFGFNHFNVKPNIITLAKGLGGGLPIGATLCDETLENTFSPSDHGSTFGGNPVACASAIVVLNKLSSQESITNINKNSSLIFETFKNLNTEKILEVRGGGLMIGIETPFSSSKIQSLALEKGLVVLTASPNVIRLLPPLTIQKEDLLKGLSILLAIIDKF
ncbi:aspartate aminotransferase family protein [uncultured Clostridium sp.]|uniref:aspartate aminotransferase family protein n=1 Tax=uncultured Clostridium sp. TaxID=59620 RepID=UPI002638DCA3|nr:aspartate aminotransferase family protein [uncultured Clostridium sp.]